MDVRLSRYYRTAIRALCMALLSITGWARTAAAFTPKSPEVREAVGRAVKYLESSDASDSRIGAQALVGMVLLKNGAPKQHPKIVAAVKAIQRNLEEYNADRMGIDIYSTGLSIIFLVDLNPEKYHREIECLLKYLQLRQKPVGGWGYPSGLNKETGDTSMTQYGVLGSWTAIQAGFSVPTPSIEAVSVWLLKTQDPSGAFGYQGTVSPDFTPVPQNQVRISMAAAGLGSLYICADMLGVQAKPGPEEEGMPDGLRQVKTEDPAATPKPETAAMAKLFRAAQARGNRWMQENYRINPKQWTHYYLYALERYQTFRELAENREEKEPKWYNDGVRFLLDTQSEQGAWYSQGGRTADTAFATLFLLRSTKIMVKKHRKQDFGPGLMIGSKGLPKDTDFVKVRKDGQVVTRPLLGPADQLLDALENPEAADYDQLVDSLAALPSAKADLLISKNEAKLRRLMSGKSPKARVAAVQALARTRNLDNVPLLILALGDAHAGVALQARDALRRIARKPTGFGMPDRPAGAERSAAVKKWKAWYLAVRPDAVFEN